MGIEWFRWFHGAVADDKWPLVARRSGQSVAVVVAVWAALLECASQAGERGSVEAFDPDSLDALLHLPDGTCQAVFDALCEGRKPRIAGGRIARWTTRQPEREDPGAAARKRSQREREREKGERAACAVPPGHVVPRAAATWCDAACPVLAGHGTRQVAPAGHETPGPVTPDKKRADKKRQEKSKEEPQAVPGHAGPPRSRSGAAEEADVSVPFVPGNAAAAAAKAEALAAGDSSRGAAGIEFQELRVFYDSHARAEAPMAGFAEYRQCRAARIWPGMDVVCKAVAAFSATDAQWKNGFAPGLARFLREQHWRRQPAGSRRAGDGAMDPVTAKNMEAAARVLARRQGGAR